MDLKEVKKIIELVEKSNITGLAIEKDGFKVEVKKEFQTAHQALPVNMVAAHSVTTNEQKQLQEENIKNEISKELTPIKSPMVGTFYSAPNPDEDPFVKAGETISKGQTICIIEAMKLFNEIESEVDGKIEQILVKNGESLEYGQVIMLVRQGG